MDIFLVHHVHHAAYLDGRPTQHRDDEGELYWDEEDGDDVKLLGAFSSEAKALGRVERARRQPGFRDEPECFVVSAHTLDEDAWTEGYVTERD